MPEQKKPEQKNNMKNVPTALEKLDGAWEDFLELREEGNELVYLMEEGEDADAWEDWMDRYADVLKSGVSACHNVLKAHKEQEERFAKHVEAIMTAAKKIKELAEAYGGDAGAEIKPLAEAILAISAGGTAAGVTAAGEPGKEANQ